MQFANSICQLHLEDNRKQFEIQAKRFWPDNHPKPEPRVIATILEESATKGTIRSCLFPILWQHLKINETQVVKMITLLLEMGIIIQSSKKAPEKDSLILPNYPNLNPCNMYNVFISKSETDLKPVNIYILLKDILNFMVNKNFAFPESQLDK